MIEAYEKGAAPAFVTPSGLNTSTFPRSSLIRSSRRNPCSFRRSEIFVRECWCPSRCNSMLFPVGPRRPIFTPPIRVTTRAAHVRLCDPPANGKLDALALNGTDDMEIYVFANEARRQAVLVARQDNLGKGASGSAVQNLELTLKGGGA